MQRAAYLGVFLKTCSLGCPLHPRTWKLAEPALHLSVLQKRQSGMQGAVEPVEKEHDQALCDSKTSLRSSFARSTLLSKMLVGGVGLREVYVQHMYRLCKTQKNMSSGWTV